MKPCFVDNTVCKHILAFAQCYVQHRGSLDAAYVDFLNLITLFLLVLIK